MVQKYRIKLPELLAPAGNFEKLVTAVSYGADAVYLGGKSLSLRAKAGNFTMEDLLKGVGFAHSHGTKVYVTLNIFANNEDFENLKSNLLLLNEAEVDGLIIADPGIFSYVRKVLPDMECHISTQANITNYHSANYWIDQGASRVNLARELSLGEISHITKKCQGELEVFVHGALCISYSGRCMLSNYMTSRDANHGSCSHPCRFSYALMEEKRPGEYFPVEEDERGTYIFNSKDLCLLKKLPELVACGVTSIKIEGRMKSIFYVGGVTRVYRAALDYLATLPGEAWDDPSEISIPEYLLNEIEQTGTRGITENFIEKKPGSGEMLYFSSRAKQLVEPVAVVREIGESILVEVRNTLKSGEEVEYMTRDLRDISFVIVSMTKQTGEKIEKANPGNMVYLEVDGHFSPEINGIMRRRAKE